MLLPEDVCVYWNQYVKEIFSIHHFKYDIALRVNLTGIVQTMEYRRFQATFFYAYQEHFLYRFPSLRC